jgi:DNA-binding CsgD family transcriptional regulator
MESVNYNNMSTLYNNYYKAGEELPLFARWHDILTQAKHREKNDIKAEERMLVENDSTIKLKKYYLSGEYDGIYLTSRERETLCYLLKGFNLQEIAQLMSLSSRTVEEYSSFIRGKLGFKFNRDLVKCLQENISIYLDIHFEGKQSL